MDLNILAQQTSAQGSVASAKDETPELESLLNRLFATAEELARAEARLSAFADRLGGPVPECAQNAGNASTHIGLASRMDALHFMLASTAGDINETISRLERLA